jgi:hypothetical protein
VATGGTTEYKPQRQRTRTASWLTDRITFGLATPWVTSLESWSREPVRLPCITTATAEAKPYGFALDKKTGHIWLADFSGNNITRFDPKTTQLVEYPLPRRGPYARFVGLDSKARLWFTESSNRRIAVLELTKSEHNGSTPVHSGGVRRHRVPMATLACQRTEISSWVAILPKDIQLIPIVSLPCRIDASFEATDLSSMTAAGLACRVQPEPASQHRYSDATSNSAREQLIANPKDTSSDAAGA